MEDAMNGATLPPAPSASVEDYLKAIWESAEPGAASTKKVADRLAVSSASVTNMFLRLQEMGFVEYERYRRVALTERGRDQALRLVRRHRLIETFLLDQLGYSWEDVHEEAERLEHAASDRFAEGLAELLGHPNQDPHGDPIPAADGTLKADDSFPLSSTKADQRVRIYRVGDEEAEKLAYLQAHGLVPGRLLKVREVRALDGVITVEDEDDEARSIGSRLAGSIFVRNVSEDEG